MHVHGCCMPIMHTPNARASRARVHPELTVSHRTPRITALHGRTASLAVAAEVQPVVCHPHSHFVMRSHMPLTMHMHVTHHVSYARTLCDALHNARSRSLRVRTLVTHHTRLILSVMGKKTATPTVTTTATISTYERKRHENIQRNKAVLEQLGLAPDERPTNKVSTVSSHHT
jgi:hypothetical protein